MGSPNRNNHPLFRSLRRASPKEQRFFLRWVKSELFTSRKGLGEAADTVLKAIKANKVTPLEVPDLQLTYLRRELDNCLAHLRFAADSSTQNRFKINVLRDQQEYRRADKMLTKCLTSIQEAPLHQEYLEGLMLHHDLMQLNLSASPERFLQAVTASSTVLNHYFVLATLQQACHLATYKLRYNTDLSLPFLQAVLQRIEEEEFWLRDHPLIAFYYRSYRVLSTNNPREGKKLSDLLVQQRQLLPNQILRDLFIILLNHNIRQLNSGVEGYARNAFALYRVGLAEKIIFINGTLSGTTILNITNIALKLAEMDWVENFLLEYYDKLSPEDQATYYPFCQANFRYERGDLDQAQEWLRQFNHSLATSPLQLNARMTQTKIYYDQQQHDLLDSHLNSFTVFLSRHEELGYTRQIVLSFTKLCRKLLYLGSHEAKKITALTEEITTIPVLSYRNWLLHRLPK